MKEEWLLNEGEEIENTGKGKRGLECSVTFFLLLLTDRWGKTWRRVR
jgi:hypothetical protein